MGNLHKNRGENKKYLSCHHLEDDVPFQFGDLCWLPCQLSTEDLEASNCHACRLGFLGSRLRFHRFSMLGWSIQHWQKGKKNRYIYMYIHIYKYLVLEIRTKNTNIINL